MTAILSLVPTPSVEETSTGSWKPKGTRQKAAKAPMPPSTSGRRVDAASGAMRRTTSSPASDVHAGGPIRQRDP